jgi:small subunit ribosomal protein S27Ae
MGKSKTKAVSSQPSKKYQFYTNGTKTRRECPKCGKGVFMGEHKNPARLHCGKCSLVELAETAKSE